MHTHTSALMAVQVFLMVLILGTFWRLGSAYAAGRGGFIGQAGKAAAFQF